MMTPQEVSSKTFPKAVMGGYGMAAVDEFLDKLTEDYTELFKENTALKGRIKQLNEKIDEYRQIEESMRATLLAAQRMADEMTAQAKAKRDAVMQEAEEKRAELMGDAETLAQKRMAELRDLVAQEERRLEEKRREVDDAVAREQVRLDRARGAVLKFMEIARGNCQEQLKILARLETMVPPAPAAQSAPAPVQSGSGVSPPGVAEGRGGPGREGTPPGAARVGPAPFPGAAGKGRSAPNGPELNFLKSGVAIFPWQSKIVWLCKFCVKKACPCPLPSKTRPPALSSPETTWCV